MQEWELMTQLSLLLGILGHYRSIHLDSEFHLPRACTSITGIGPGGLVASRNGSKLSILCENLGRHVKFSKVSTSSKSAIWRRVPGGGAISASPSLLDFIEGSHLKIRRVRLRPDAGSASTPRGLRHLPIVNGICTSGSLLWMEWMMGSAQGLSAYSIRSGRMVFQSPSAYDSLWRPMAASRDGKYLAMDSFQDDGGGVSLVSITSHGLKKTCVLAYPGVCRDISFHDLHRVQVVSVTGDGYAEKQLTHVTNWSREGLYQGAWTMSPQHWNASGAQFVIGSLGEELFVYRDDGLLLGRTKVHDGVQSVTFLSGSPRIAVLSGHRLVSIYSLPMIY